MNSDAPSKVITLTEVLTLLPQEFSGLNLTRLADRGHFPHYVRASRKSDPVFNRAAVMDWIDTVYGSVLEDSRWRLDAFPFTKSTTER